MTNDTPSAATHAITVDDRLPAGNIIVDGIDGDVLHLRQDLRDTEGHWFYWCCRVLGAAGRTIDVRLGDRDLLPAFGPCASFDCGENWAWQPDAVVDDRRFKLAVPEDCDELRLSMTIPYVSADLKRVLKLLPDGVVRRETLCATQAGRTNELFRVGSASPSRRVLVTARHHACESAANYALEGCLVTVALAQHRELQKVLGDSEFVFIPFVDLDGVEAGDQGKHRRPHDHNRDYADASEPIYPTVRAIKELVRNWGDEPFVTVDLHCPWIKDNRNTDIYIVGSRHEHNWQAQRRFADVLHGQCRGPLPYDPATTLPHGVDWNNFTGPPRSCSAWMATQPACRLATTIELPYALAGGEMVTADKARAFGDDLARALAAFVENR